MKNLKSSLQKVVSSFFLFTIIGLSLYNGKVKAQTQLPECQSTVPFFNINLSADPDSTYVTPEITRNGQCCGSPNNENYVSFYVTLHPDVAMIEIGIMPGYADPGGSGNYRIITGGNLITPGSCGAAIPGGTTSCITGVGPHKITYYKPGSNKVKYYLRQIPKPIFPKDDSTRVGCTKPLNIYGLNNIQITSINSSTGNTTPGAYNSLLSCTNCPNPVFTPGLATPTWIDYRITGNPIALSTCGTYVTVDTVRIYSFPTLNASVTPNPASFCSGGGGVTLTASGSGGLPPYSYIWRNSSNLVVGTGSTFLATSQGNFTVEVIDQLNTTTCLNTYRTVPVSIGNPPVVNAGADDTVCAQSPTIFLQGSVQFATGGIWSGGAGTYNPSNTSLLAAYTPTPTEISNGFVTLTLTSTGAGGGCTNASDQVTFYFSPAINVNPTALPFTCNGTNTTISANATGGTPPLTYTWNTGATTSSIIAPAGTYSVMVRDAIGCVSTGNITVVEPPAIILNLSSTNTSTDFACDGDASVAVFGGVPPYTITWSNGDTGNNADNLCYGIVTVTVTDASGCVVTGSVVVNKPSCSLFSVTASGTNVSCYAGTNGTASSSLTGGTAPFTYAWSTTPVQTTPNASNLSAGTYTVTVTDGNGCIDIASVTLTQPTVITNTMLHTDATSIGGTNGTATANPSGGTPPYTYAWNTTPPQNTQTASNLAAGVYQVLITDFNGCQKLDSVLINQPPCNNFILAVTTTNVVCHGQSNGAASLLIAHGTPPYNIVWSSGHLNVTNVSGLAAGNYNVTVTDASNCTTFRNFTITEPDSLTIGLVATNITCFGANDGTIDLTVSGGIYPYTFQWFIGPRPISSTEDLVNLETGTYSVIVTDANGCTITGNIGITQPAQLVANHTRVDVTCNGGTNGSIDVTPTGGTPPYTYSWVGPASYTNNTQDISGLAFGLYELTITDGSSCNLLSPLQVYINQPDTVIIRNVAVPCPAAGATTVTVNVDTITGGAGVPYQVSFNNGVTFQASGVYTATLALGNTYQVVARDSNGCLSPVFNLILNPSVVIDSVVFNRCIPNGNTTIPVTVYPNGGDGGPYQVSTDGGVTYNASGTYVFNLNVNSNYSIVIRDARGCVSLATNITIPAELIATAVQTAQVTCLGGNDGVINLTVTGGTTAYTYAWTGPGSYTNNVEDISGLQAGTYNVTVTDAFGCTATASTTVTTVPDVTNPTISCPSNISVQNNTGICGAVVTYATPVGLDNCPGASTALTAGLASGATFPVGLTTVTYTVTDTVGNSASCSFTVTVADTTKPLISGCPANIIVNNDLNTCGAVVNWTAPTASDNCSVTSFTSNFNPGATFPVGTTTVTYTASDSTGNTTTCSFTITVNDTTFPVISNCPTNITAYSVSNQCGVNVSWTAPTATDNCGSVTTSASHAPNSFFNVGTTTVTYNFTDAANNVSTCTFTVTVVDTIKPIISGCPSNITVSNNGTACGNTVTWTAPTASDNCGIQSFTTSHNPGTFFPVGTTTVTYTATDVNSNITTCTFTVTVNDTTKPVIANCPSNISIFSTAAACGNTATWTAPTATDNCATVTTVSTHNSGDFFPVGTTTVTYTFTDAANNVSTCSFTVTVVDTVKPVITGCPANITVSNNGPACSNTVSWTAPTALDNCAISTFTSTHNPGATFNVGTTTVTYTATDVNGNVSICSFTVTVNDTTLPIISNCPSNISIFSTAVACGNTATWTAPTATDNCGTVTVTSSHNPGAFFPVGVTTVTYNFTDASNNVSTCTFTVTVVDTIKPIITGCPSNITVSNNGTACGNTVTWVAPTATDNCAIATFTTTHAPGSFFPVGTTTVTYTATDVNSNVTTCSFTVTVNDTTKPVIANCPSNISIFSTAAACGNTATWTAPTATDNCATVTTVSTHNSGDFFPVGTTTVTYTFTDAASNVSTCTFTVTVVDTIKPIITGCPSNIIVQNNPVQCGNTVTWTAPTTTDNCGIVNMSSSHNPGDFFPVGTTTVTYTSVDQYNNTSICSFTVTVNDTTLPVFTTCPTNITVSNNGAQCGNNVLWTAPTATDNCGTTTITSTHTPGSFFAVGTHTVTYTVTDNSGNSSICQFTVTVNDTTKPFISSCPANISIFSTAVACGNTATWTAPTAIDNCDGPITPVASHNPGDFFPVGVTTVSYTFTDAANNVTICTFTVTVVDTVKPIIANCPANISVSNDVGVCGATVTWTPPTATDNCTTVNVVSTHNPGDFFALGTTQVGYTFTDASGNSVTCNFNVTVTDNEPPVISNCPADTTVSNDAGQCGAIVSWTAPTATDNCTSFTVSSTHAPGSFFNVGTTTVTYTFTDNANNITTCSFDVTVNDTELPQITCATAVASCDSNIVYNAPVVLDNCAVASVQLTSGIGSGNIFPVGTTIDTYTVTDIHGNTNTCSVSVTVHPTPEVLLSVTNVACYGDSTGAIDATVNSGTPVFTYMWNNLETTEDISGLTPGVYSVTVTDANLCSASAVATITQPDKLIAAIVTTDILCNGDNNGAIDVTVTGGVAPYTYSWSNGSTDEDLTGLSSGTYTLTVTDANNCSEVNVITLIEPQPLSVTSTSVPATCLAPNGIIDITVLGGIAPYSYSWSNGSNNQDLVGVATGSYTVTVTDANACVIVYADSVASTSNMQLTAVVKNALCYQDASGSIDLSPSMGLSPYTYTWSNGATTEDLNNLLAGTYTVVVTDANFCTITETFVITESDSLYVELTSPIYHGTNNISTYGGSDGSIELTVNGGTAPYTYSWSNGMTIEDINGLPVGNYSVIVTDANGCTAYGVIVLKEPNDIELPEGFSPNGDGKNDYFVVKGLEAYPDNDFVVYNRWGNKVYEKNGYANEWDGRNNSGENLPDATYFVILKISGKDQVYKGYVDLRRK